MKKERMMIRPEIKMTDGYFGIGFEIPEFPKGCRKMLVSIQYDNGKIKNVGTFLPHQLYLEGLLKYSSGMINQVLVTPIYEPIKLLKKRE